MYIGTINPINETPGAIKITAQGLELTGRSDRAVYLPKSQIKIRKEKNGEFTIFVPDWLVYKNRLNWNRITEIKPYKGDIL